jgi:hypothetical protein
MAFSNSAATEESSTAEIMKAIWPGGMSDPDGSGQKLHGVLVPSDIEMKDCSSFADRLTI